MRYMRVSCGGGHRRPHL